MKFSGNFQNQANKPPARCLMLICLVLVHLSSSLQTRTLASELSSNQKQEQEASKTIQQTSSSPSQVAAASEKNQAIKQQLREEAECQYEKSPWSECHANGEQTRTFRLIKDQKSSSGGTRNEPKCPKVKLVRRECKQGCKYIRGDWSPDCVNGQRVRIDTLVARVDSSSASKRHQQHQQHQQQQQQQQQQDGIKCEPQRKVTKDCRRACHYVKSAWSECTNGFKTRDLRLEELPSSSSPAPSSASASASASSPSTSPSLCAKHRQIKRECKSYEANKPAAKPTTATHQSTSVATQSQQPQQLLQREKEHPQKLTLAQKRRLKQLQRQQKQQQQQLAQNNNNNNKSI